MKISMTMDEKLLETFASGSLIGNLLKDHKFSEIDDVELVFPQSTLHWRQQNRGPKIYLIPEYTVPLLIEDVLKLLELGIKVTVKTPPLDL